ncbi:hypothetical protein D3C83_37520 [compost metagenome]
MLLYGLHDPRLVLVGVESRRDVGQQPSGQDDQAAQREQRVLEEFHGWDPPQFNKGKNTLELLKFSGQARLPLNCTGSNGRLAPFIRR